MKPQFNSLLGKARANAFVRGRYVARKLEEAAESSNTLVKKLVDFFVCCCRCCLWCLEKCLRFINKNAYIETALYGIDFFSGCYRAVNTIMANILTCVAPSALC